MTMSVARAVKYMRVTSCSRRFLLKSLMATGSTNQMDSLVPSGFFFCLFCFGFFVIQESSEMILELEENSA